MTSTLKDFNKARASFMRKASAPHVSPLAFKLAYLIAYKYMNAENWTARPSQETLAHDLGRAEVRTVQRHARRLASAWAGRRPRTRTEPLQHLLDRSRRKGGTNVAY